MWDADGHVLRSMKVHDDYIMDMKYCNNGQEVVTVGLDKKACLIDVERMVVNRKVGLESSAYCVVYEDVNKIFIGLMDGSVYLYDARALRKNAPVISFLEHQGNVRV